MDLGHAAGNIEGFCGISRARDGVEGFVAVEVSVVIGVEVCDAFIGGKRSVAYGYSLNFTAGAPVGVEVAPCESIGAEWHQLRSEKNGVGVKELFANGEEWLVLGIGVGKCEHGCPCCGEKRSVSAKYSIG